MAEKSVPARLFGIVARPLQAFWRLEAASGILLLISAAAALAWANLDPRSYQTVFDYPFALGAGEAVASFTFRELINDGLMTIFFFVVGMEIKRELVVGELNTVAKAALPAVAAVGGMALPAGIYLLFTWSGPGRMGWGIPMATDIAFCIGILTLLRDRVPHALVVFVTALAIFDDIGGILVIALFYGHGLSLPWLLAALGWASLLMFMNRRYVTNGMAYASVGACLWYSVHHGGIHPTVAGVVLGLSIPTRARRPSRDVLGELRNYVSLLFDRAADEDLDAAEILMIEEKLEDLEAPLYRFEHRWHPFMAFFVMPVFALANSGVSLKGVGVSALGAPVALGTILGLFAGKQIGIFGFTALAVRLGLAPIPGKASWLKLYGVSTIAGVGFTVALFIGALAFAEAPALLAEAKLGILVGSLLAGAAGFLVLRFSGRR
jgi:NhaA family Na+:H+ antiporter